MVSSFIHRVFAKLPGNASVVAWLVVLPLVFAAFSFWEYTQYSPATVTAGTQARQEQIAELQDILKRINADRNSVLEIDGKRYTNAMARQKLGSAIAGLRKGHAAVVSWVAPAALVGVAAGLLSALIGALGLVLVARSAQQALRSRDDLMRTFVQWRHRLPVFLGGLLVLLAVSGAALAAVRGFVLYEDFVGKASGGALKFDMFLTMGAGLLLWGSLVALWRLRGTLEVLESTPSEVMGQSLTPDQAPGLWSYVRDMARRAGAPVPRNVVVGVTESFYVTAHDMLLLPSQQHLTGETMYLPLTYLSLLDRSEIDAIVAHELGHFVGEDTAYSQKFSPIYQRLTQNFHALSHQDIGEFGSLPARAFVEYLVERFHLAVMHWSRIREFAADQAGARVAGAEASARALVRITSLVPVVHAVLAEVSRRPDEAGQDLAQTLGDAVRERGLEPPDFAVETATAHPSDTHPPTLERIAALGVAMGPELQAAALAPHSDASAQWLRTLFADSTGMQTQLFDAFKNVSRTENSELREFLTQVAQEGDLGGEMEVNDGRGILLVFVLLTLACMGGLYLALRAENPSVVGLLVFAGVTASLAYGTWWCWKRTQSIVMNVGPSGIRAPGMQGALSWGQVQQCEGHLAAGTLSVVLHLEPETPAPVLLHSNLRRLSYARKRHKLTISLYGPRGMKPEAFFDTIQKYRTAWFARDALEKM